MQNIPVRSAAVAAVLSMWAVASGCADSNRISNDQSGGAPPVVGGFGGDGLSAGAGGSGALGGSGATGGVGATGGQSGGGGQGGTDTVPPDVQSVSPADGATLVSPVASIAVTFSEPMDPSSVTAGTDGQCAGAVQVSADGFSSCVAMTGPPATSDDVTFVFTPQEPLASLGQYAIRVADSATDAAQNPLSAPFETAQGFGVSFHHTVVIDGVNDFGAADSFVTSTGASTLYVTHDDANVYVGLSSPEIAPGGPGNKFVYFLLSTDPQLATGNPLSSDGKVQFGTSASLAYHYKEQIAGGFYSEYRVANGGAWTTDWGTQNKSSYVGAGYLEASIAWSELGGPSSLVVTAYTVDYDGSGGAGWVYNMLAGATDGPATTPVPLATYVELSLPGAAAPNDAAHVKSF